MPFAWTPETRTQLQQLRSEGLSQVQCAKIIGCSDSVVFNALHPEKKKLKQPKLKPKPEKVRPRTNCSTPRILHSSCPMRRRHTDPEARNAPQLTKAQLYYDLAVAVRNTARLSGIGKIT
jgi:hypothetical protein